MIYDGNTVTAYPHGSEPVVFRHGGGRQNPHRHHSPPHRLVLRRAGALPVLHSEGKPSPLVPRERILAVLDLLETALEADGSN